MVQDNTHNLRAQPYNRDTALDAAQSLFWCKGYHATSLKDLQKALNMKPGSIYAAFKSKENLYLLTLERYYTMGRAQIESFLTSAPSPLQGLSEHLRIYGQGDDGSAQNKACMLVKTLLETTEEDAAITARTREYLDDIYEMFVTAFEAAQSRGEIDATVDPAQLARKYQAYISALRIEAHRGVKGEALAALCDEFIQDINRL